MMKRILAAIGIGSVAVSSAADKELVGPYKDHSTNLIYHLLFCDRLKLFEDNHQGELNDPWDKDRLPAPSKGNVRMTFLVSDGLYFGEGPMDVMQQEQMAAPLIQAATTLLLQLVERTTNSEQDGSDQPATHPESKSEDSDKPHP